MGTGYLGTAATNAANDARQMVPMLVALKRCPRCGVRDERIARRNVRTRITILVIFGVIALGFAITVGALLASDNWNLGIATGAGIALVMGLVCWIQHRVLAMRLPSDAEAAVVLGDLPAGYEAQAAPTGWKYI